MTAIYARYSTELQSEKSIDDQIALCRTYAAREGLSVTNTFSDSARSGASTIGRDGLAALMAGARNGDFKVVVVEALDRISRDQEDLAGIYKRLDFLGVEIRAVHEGVVDTIQIGVRGLVGALYLQDLAHKVRRGMTGVVASGRHAGGRAYGYTPVTGKPGELEIVPGEAEVVQRIFSEYAKGRAPRSIAGDLNREGIAAPRGTTWNASTINGNAARGNGILQNELYAGQIVWNKVRMIKNPDTGRRISRPNPPGEWSRTPAPHLRIIDADIWDEVRAIKQAKRQLTSHKKREPAHLLSGFLRCGVCGGGMSVHDRDKTGKVRIRCSRFRESGACSNRRIIYLDPIQRAVTSGLGEQLKHPAVIAEYVRTYNDERQRLSRAEHDNRGKLERRLAKARAEMERALDVIVKGIVAPETLQPRIQALEVEIAEASAALEMADEPAKVIELHPALLNRYVDLIEEVHEMLENKNDSSPDDLRGAFRELIESVIITPGAPRAPVEIEVQGRLANLIGTDVPPAALYSGSRVVAEVRYTAKPTLTEPLFSFRCVA